MRVGTPLRLTIVPSDHPGVKVAMDLRGMAEKFRGEVIYWSETVFSWLAGDCSWVRTTSTG
jgi:hypothetical protein